MLHSFSVEVLDIVSAIIVVAVVVVIVVASVVAVIFVGGATGSGEGEGRGERPGGGRTRRCVQETAPILGAQGAHPRKGWTGKLTSFCCACVVRAEPCSPLSCLPVCGSVCGPLNISGCECLCVARAEQCSPFGVCMPPVCLWVCLSFCL